MTTETLLRVRVAAKQKMAEEVWGFAFATADKSELPGFEPGAHIDVHVLGGLTRQYSLHDLPGSHGQYRVSVLRDPQSRGGSTSLIDHVQEGDILTISAPRNHFHLDSGGGNSILLAGGIGVTPILCMAQQLARDQRPFELHYCGRTLSRMAFLDRLSEADLQPHVRLHVDDGPPEQRLAAAGTIGAPAADKHLYVCGPTGFMDHVLNTARALGWDDEHLHREYFAAAPIDHSADGPFEIELGRSGKVIRVATEESAAQALLRAGLDLSLSCEQGVCGTCITTVLRGVPDHRDLYFTDAEHARNDCFTPCCSRAKTPRLVLDL
ncbi:PDR/VanB family oxidoreductase [Variovorax sp. LT1R16]|uniref:PDR/VanB family oxidoreductase n=1 Tax=Variovorax sp. LT1R16 TaxID=3443728 RepID=UPI003F47FBAC